MPDEVQQSQLLGRSGPCSPTRAYISYAPKNNGYAVSTPTRPIGETAAVHPDGQPLHIHFDEPETFVHSRSDLFQNPDAVGAGKAFDCGNGIRSRPGVMR